jgi:hypothetical protein
MPTRLATQNLPAPHGIYQIKLTLLGTKPPIWRRLLVPAGLTLEQLHHVVQAAMGWQDSHLHSFRIGQKSFRIPDPEDALMGLPGGDERKARLFTVLGKVGSKAVYTYDFGDDWEHSISVEKVLQPEEGRTYPVCVAGKRRGPPEDCGGIPGFYNLLEAISDPDHEDHEEMQDWIGGDFDPEDFSVDEVNEMLKGLQHGGREA